MRIYIDTSVINGLYAQDRRIRESTEYFFQTAQHNNYVLYGSEVVALEIKATPDVEKRKLLIKVVEDFSIEILPVSKEVENLASCYVKNKIIPARYKADAQHIACCVIHNIPVLVSWNFKHIVKHKTRVEVNLISRKLNLPEIDICSPEEV